MSNSTGLGIATILGCLDSGEKIMNVSPSGWYNPGGKNADLDYFVQWQASWRRAQFLLGDNLRSFANTDPQKVFAKAQEWAMRLQMPPVFAPGAVYMISQYKELLNWAVSGDRIDGRFPWPSFHLKKAVSFYRVPLLQTPLVSTSTTNGDVVYMARFPQPLAGFELLKTVELIEKTRVGMDADFDGVIVPMVYTDLNPDLGWILGMKNKDWFVAWAKQKIQFGMNETGFAVREETGMVTMRFVRKPEPFVLSPNGESFLFWRRRMDVPYPLSLYQFAAEDFKDPGELSAIVA